jgi:hypothetical protein
LIIVVTGLVVAIAPVVAACIRPIRRVELDLPDTVSGTTEGAAGVEV